ncbi:hypothetical protein [Nocardioides sp. YIM 152315]|uniref:hypothetical protein n=1 Tax=Nocardioides sp. YIM 152315 TaxID=3031760 RepID=UPI0023DABBFC|nr:hypothetical protein [Nocardioides sp. YIM 152315]MDF1603024.1 hypothetical protein [Nocardioides sp. YIM 152315]
MAEEAAKLLGALSGWAKDATHDLEGHLATGAPECTYCPICRTVHAARSLSPEVTEQLATAATSALQALAGLLSAAGRASPSRDGEGGVEHIDLDEGAEDWPDDHTDPEEGDR